MPNAPRYWFPAKRYGWGWGPPITWEGWAAVAVFVALVVAGVFMFPPRSDVGAFVIYIVILNIGLIVVCRLKGEPPRWRWGGD